MKTNKTKSLIVWVLVLAAYVIVALLVPFEKNVLFWVEFAFTLVAIFAQAYVMKSAFDKGDGVKSKFYGFPIARIGVIYLIVQLIAGFALMAFSFVVPMWVALIINFIVLIVFAIGLVAAETMRDEIERQDEKIKKDVAAMRSFQSKTASFVTLTERTDMKAILTELAEKFKFSDPVSSEAVYAIETDLAAGIDELERALVDKDYDSAKVLCKNVEARLAERNRVCRLNK